MRDGSNGLALPVGFQVRAPNIEDLPEVFALLTTCDLAYLGTPDTVLEDLREEWEGIDLEHDAFLVLGPDSRPAGLAILKGQVKVRADAYVHPEYARLGIEGYLRHLMETRAQERARAAGALEPIKLETWISSRQEADVQLLRSMGYELAERYRRMRIDMNKSPLEPEWPEGIRIRTAVQGEDQSAVYERFRWVLLMSGTLRRDPFEGRDRDAVRSMWQRGIHQGGTGSTRTPAVSVSCLRTTPHGALRLRL